MPVKRDEPDLLGGRAYQAIKQAITRCELQPTELVTESGLAERFQLGKAPIRAALIRLSHEGLVLPIARRGHQVSPITIKHVHDTFELRILLETEGALLAAGSVDEDYMRKLDAECAAGYDRTQPSDVARYLLVNKQIHAAITSASGNERLAAVHHDLLDDMERIFHYALRLGDESLEIKHDHELIIDALVRPDGREAARATAQALRVAETAIVAVLKGKPEFMAGGEPYLVT
jgi:DNA-binding GntR family transcriptional regulator